MVEPVVLEEQKKVLRVNPYARQSVYQELGKAKLQLSDGMWYKLMPEVLRWFRDQSIFKVEFPKYGDVPQETVGEDEWVTEEQCAKQGEPTVGFKKDEKVDEIKKLPNFDKKDTLEETTPANVFGGNTHDEKKGQK